MNINTLKGLGMVILVGMAGGFLSQKIMYKKYQKELEDREAKWTEELEAMKANAKTEMNNEARMIIRNAIDAEVKDDMVDYIEKNVRAMPFNEIVEEGVKNGIKDVTERAYKSVKDESTKDLKEEIRELAKEVVEDKIQDELYKVNSRRIIEDSVDRAVREEVRVQVKDKVKKFNIPSWFSGDDIAKVLYAL